MMVVPAPSPLHAWVDRPDSTFAWTPREAGGAPGFTLTSQTWQGRTWKHHVAWVEPKEPLARDRAILFITGDYRDRDIDQARFLAEKARLPVAMLFDSPNQPDEGRKEDELIAYTFGRWLETGDETWPLLFPMTKAAIRAMDAVGEFTQGRVKRFVVSGASKRGWTAWLAGAVGDERVKGIAPMVIDVLNMPAQLKHQREMLGGLSGQIQDYSSTGLTELIESEPGKRLVEMVDPYSHLAKIKVPVLAVIGANDEYWTVDAHSLYWDKVPSPKLLRIVPNAGHGLGSGVEAAESLAFFARGCFGLIPGGLPKLEWSPSGDFSDPRSPKPLKTLPWVATSESLNFHDSSWMDSRLVRLRGDVNQAMFTEYRFRDRELEASFTTGVTVRRAAKP